MSGCVATPMPADRGDLLEMVEPDLLDLPGARWAIENAPFVWICGNQDPFRVHLIIPLLSEMRPLSPEIISRFCSVYDNGCAIMVLGHNREVIDRAAAVLNAASSPPAGSV